MQLAILLLAAYSYFYTTNQATALKFVSALDQACGYPNPATKTFTAVSITATTNKEGAFYTVLVPDGVYAPALKAGMTPKTVLPNDRLADPIVTNATSIATSLAAVPKTKPPTVAGKLDVQDFILISPEVKATIETNTAAVITK